MVHRFFRANRMGRCTTIRRDAPTSFGTEARVPRRRTGGVCVYRLKEVMAQWMKQSVQHQMLAPFGTRVLRINYVISGTHPNDIQTRQWWYRGRIYRSPCCDGPGADRISSNKLNGGARDSGQMHASQECTIQRICRLHQSL